MTIGGSIFLIAVGAILTFAVSANEVAGISVDMIGIILMIAGLVGLLIGLYFWNSAGRRSATTGTASRSETVVERRTDSEI